MANSSFFSAEKRTKEILSALSQYECKSVFFCIGQSSKKLKNCLKMVDDEGHFLANHSMSHQHLSKQSITDWESELKKTEDLLHVYKNMKKWFRYPFLDYGDRADLGGSLKKKQDSRESLKSLGYREGYVTINTFDWHIEHRWKKELKSGKSIDYGALKKTYIGLLEEWCKYYVELYKLELKEEVTHTLLLHANDLNALYLKDILKMIKSLNWNLVSPEKAFEKGQWREASYKLNFIGNKPKTLDCKQIDLLLEKNKVFKESLNQNVQS